MQSAYPFSPEAPSPISPACPSLLAAVAPAAHLRRQRDLRESVHGALRCVARDALHLVERVHHAHGSPLER
eukprot:361894-Chlamydomonas_euryale.AAC.6